MTSSRSQRFAASLPAGPRQSSVHQLIRLAREPVDFVEDCHAKYGDVFTMRLFGLPPVVTFTQAEAAREIFACGDDVAWAGETARPIEVLVGGSSLTRLDGARHKRERKLMMSAVHGERIVAYGAAMRAIADSAISNLEAGQSVVLQDIMQEITMHVIMRTVFGFDQSHPVKGLLTDFLRLAMKPSVSVLAMIVGGGDRLRLAMTRHYAPIVEKASRLGGPLAHLPLRELAVCARDLDAVLFDEIRRRRRDARGDDIMSLLVDAKDEDGKGLSDEELRDEMMTLLVGGHETTATMLSWAIALCLEHPPVLANLRAEYERLMGAAGELDLAKLPELKYTDAVLRETMRLYPISVGVLRRLKKPTTIGGLALPAEAAVMACAYLVHRDARVWPEPARFDPERFVDRKPRPGEWFPFGGGMRTCLGMAFSLYEMKVVLARIVQRTTLRLEGAMPRLGQRSFLLGPTDPIRLTVEKIDPVRAANNEERARSSNHVGTSATS